MRGSVDKDAEKGTWYFVFDAPRQNGRRKQVKRRGFKKRHTPKKRSGQRYKSITNSDSWVQLT